MLAQHLHAATHAELLRKWIKKRCRSGRLLAFTSDIVGRIAVLSRFQKSPSGWHPSRWLHHSPGASLKICKTKQYLPIQHPSTWLLEDLSLCLATKSKSQSSFQLPKSAKGPDRHAARVLSQYSQHWAAHASPSRVNLTTLRVCHALFQLSVEHTGQQNPSWQQFATFKLQLFFAGKLNNLLTTRQKKNGHSH